MNQRLLGSGLPDLDLALRYRLTVLVVGAKDHDVPSLGRWIEHAPCRVTVVPLTAKHSDLRVFIEALERSVDGTLPVADRVELPAQDRIIELLNALVPLATDLCIVLKDYDVIHETAVHEAVSFVLDYLPPRVHILIVTDVSPPLGNLARLLVRRQALLLKAPADDPAAS